MIPWLCRLIHHFSAAASRKSKVILLISGTFTTDPAELKLTESTSHVVAPSALLNLCPTHGTERHILFVFLSPGTKLLVQSLLASNILTVPHITALEADSCFAFRAPNTVYILTFCNYVSTTVCLWTVPSQWILIDLVLLFEPLELFKQICRQIDDQNLFIHLFQALVVQAFDFVNQTVF